MNKGAIRTHFKELLNRSDITDSLADTFISQSITRIERTLRIPPMERRQAITIDAQVSHVVVPNDLLEMIDVYYAFTVLSRIPLHEMLSMKDVGQTGTPRHFSIQGENLLLYPEPTVGTLTISYYGEFTAMTSDSDENALAKTASDIIIYGALGYAADYYLDERAQTFDGKFGQMMTEIQEQANEAEQSGGLMIMRPTQTYTDY